MKYLKPLCIFTLPLMWCIYFLFELFTGRIKDLSTIIGNIALIILFICVGFIIYKISEKFEDGFSKKALAYIFLILMLIDQGSKIIIKLFFFKTDKEIIKNFLFFHPIINTDGSWLNARFNTSVSFSLLIFINFLALLLFVEIYRYYLMKNNLKKDFWIDMCFLFIISGALCSLIDKVFYGGSLDFIGISNLFIADIKDIYINLGILFFVLTLYNTGYLSSEEETTFKDDINNIKKFFMFIKKDLLSFLKK